MVYLVNPIFCSPRILLYSGSSSSVILGKHAQKLQNNITKPVHWSKKGCRFNTNYTSKVEIVLSEIDAMKIRMQKFYMDDSQVCHRYEMIPLLNILPKLNIYLCLPNINIRENVGAYEGCTSPTKDVSKVNFNSSSNWTKENSFRNKGIW